MKTQGGIALSTKEQFTLSILSKFRAHEITREQAAEILQLSERQVTRLSKRIYEDGVKGVIHKNTGKTPANKTSCDLRRQIIQLYKGKYSNFNMIHALQMIEKEQGLKVPYSVFRRWCAQEQIQKVSYRRAKPRNLRQRFAAPGLMLQMDGSPHKWNGRTEWCLINIIDDSTSEIPFAEFFPAEDTLSCMRVLRRVIEKKGIPVSLYVDKAGLYGGTAKRTDFSQFGRACKELGIEVIYADSAQGKGRVERSFRTCQDRLLAELHHFGHLTIPAANDYLQKVFLLEYWNKELTVEPKSNKSHYRPLNHDINIDEIFCMKDKRKVRLNHTISIDSVHYKVTPPDSFSIANRNVEIRTYEDHSWKVFFNDKQLEVEKLDEPPRKSQSMAAQISTAAKASQRAQRGKSKLALLEPPFAQRRGARSPL